MTWHDVPRIRALSLPLCVWFVVGCGSSSKSASIEITAPEKGATLTTNDDLDKVYQQGLQYTVMAKSSDLDADTEVYMQVEGQNQAAISKVAKDGSIKFESVTLPPGKHAITVSTKSDSVRSAEDHEYTYQAIVIATPRDRALLGKADDKDDAADGIQIEVDFTTFALKLNDEVRLLVDGRQVDAIDELETDDDGNGKGEFHAITLSDGDHTLQAVSGNVESDTSEVTVNSNCATATFVMPAPPTGDADVLLLPGGDKCPASGEPYKQRFRVATDVGDGRDMELYVNGQLFDTQTVKDSVVEFADVELEKFSENNTVFVRPQSAQGSKCPDISYPVPIKLDCTGVDCAVTAPQSVAGRDASGATVQYVNGTQASSNGFAFTVSTDSASVGTPVKLVVDGNESDAPTAQPSGSGASVVAKFSGVKLSDGQHTVQAICQHGSSGTSGRSRKYTWTVDTKACGVSITEPSANAVLVSSQDTVSNLNGVQIALASNVTGDDCTRTRSAPCGAIGNGSFEDFDGKSPLSSTLTLGDGDKQTLCVEVEDRAGNVGRGTVDVSYRTTEPKLAIERPANNTKFNSAGGSGYTEDSDRSDASKSVCNANFDVACSELGVEVALHRDSETGPTFATATCEAKGANDPALPDGYAGRARFSNAAFLANGATAATVIATQGLGPSGSALVGKSGAITLNGDCTAPTLTFSGTPCGDNNQLGVTSAAPTVSKDVVVNDPSTGASNATLTVTDNASPPVTSAPVSATRTGTGPYTFTNVAFGGAGTRDAPRTVTIKVAATDDYGNVGETTCNATIVFDLPTLTVAQPTEGLVLTPSSPAWCTIGTSEGGVLVAATADSATNRAATAVVTGVDTPTTLTLSGTAISGCVPLQNGSRDIEIKLTSTESGGFASVKRKVVVASKAPAVAINLGDITPPTTRTGAARFNWPAPSESGIAYSAYELRCDPGNIGPGTDKETWWTNARVMALPSDVKPPANQANVSLHTGERLYCALRAVDAANQRTPIDQTKEITVPFTEKTYTPGSMGQSAGADLAAIGDVNGDNIDDLLVGGFGEAYLVFGRTTQTFAGAPTAPDVTFRGADASTFGSAVTGLGDFNGDGLNDFAIADYSYNNQGRVLVYFGHTSSDPWPGTVLTESASCVADVCFQTTDAATSFGFSVAAAGNFDGDTFTDTDGTTIRPRQDLIVGAPNWPNTTLRYGRIYVLRGQTYGTRAQGQSFYGAAVDVGSQAGVGFALNGEAVMEGVTQGANDTLQLGQAVTGVGDFDTGTGADIVVTSLGCGGSCSVVFGRTTPVTGKAFFLSGRTYPTGSPTLQVLTLADAGLRLIDSGAAGVFGSALFTLGNVYNVPTANRRNVLDIAIWQGEQASFVIYPGDNNFAVADRVQVRARLGTALALGVGNGADFITGRNGISTRARGDLDNDGLVELAAAYDFGDVTPPPANLWYGQTLAGKVSGATINEDYASLLQPPVGVDDTGRVIEYVGDLNADGEPDLAVGSLVFGDGQWTVLY